jgi:hypothetical protein
LASGMSSVSLASIVGQFYPENPWARRTLVSCGDFFYGNRSPR